MPDYPGVGCDGYREALSARLDGEETSAERAALDAHLATCAGCRGWWDDAAVVTRLVRTGPALAGVDVTEAVLPAAPGRWRGRLAVALRLALGGLGLAQLVLGMLQVTFLRSPEPAALHGTTVDGATPGHLWHESAAWNLAVGAAFIWIAARRGRPVGVVPLLTAFVAALVMLSAGDVIGGRVEAARLASHGFVVAGYLLVLVLSRTSLDLLPPGRRESRPGHRGRARPEPVPDRSGDGTVIPFPRPDRGQPAARIRHREAA
jgi:predicted anti-sigma-YlaC factor YlaD